MKFFLETQRLILRYFTEDDADHLFELDSDHEVIRFTNIGLINGGEPTDTDYEAIKNKKLPRFLKYYENSDGYGVWAALEKSSNEFIGWFFLRPALDNTTVHIYSENEIELGYRLRKVAWGKGYATEGSRSLIVKGFCELDTQRIVATALVANTASIRVMEKAGLKFEKTFIDQETNQKGVKYALNKEEFSPEKYMA
jgi:RimJ/RimL family protein N-acetyltransferase